MDDKNLITVSNFEKSQEFKECFFKNDLIIKNLISTYILEMNTKNLTTSEFISLLTSMLAVDDLFSKIKERKNFLDLEKQNIINFQILEKENFLLILEKEIKKLKVLNSDVLGFSPEKSDQYFIPQARLERDLIRDIAEKEKKLIKTKKEIEFLKINKNYSHFKINKTGEIVEVKELQLSHTIFKIQDALKQNGLSPLTKNKISKFLIMDEVEDLFGEFSHD